ncbi:hypothetical protein B0H14DRAFT_3467217 [Mycena olivaceomarginata]|nr:hypothetical protein B0H14DRAFT_3467217 [Mycena olivaceomarginata]
MLNALVVVMSTPELLELTLSHLPMRDLLVTAPARHRLDAVGRLLYDLIPPFINHVTSEFCICWPSTRYFPPLPYWDEHCLCRRHVEPRQRSQAEAPSLFDCLFPNLRDTLLPPCPPTMPLFTNHATMSVNTRRVCCPEAAH